MLQAVTRNPLADPHLLGADLRRDVGRGDGVPHVGEITGLLTSPIAAFIGAMPEHAGGAGGGQPQWAAGEWTPAAVRVAVSFVMMAGQPTCCCSWATTARPRRRCSGCSAGLGLARWELLAIPCATVLLGLLVLLGMARPLNALMAGEQTSVDPGPERPHGALEGVPGSLDDRRWCPSVAPSVFLVGLMVPHIARRLVGAEHARLLPTGGAARQPVPGVGRRGGTHPGRP